MVTVSGGNITDVDFSGPCPGLEVITVDYDTEGETDPEAVEMVDQSSGHGEPWSPAYVTRYDTENALSIATTPAMRPATAEDLA